MIEQWISYYERATWALEFFERKVFNHLKSIILPNVGNEGMNLQLQDYKIINENNFALFRIDKNQRWRHIVEIFSTFYASNMVPQQQYRACKYKKCFDLISCLLVVEKNNELALDEKSSISFNWDCIICWSKYCLL